jgi:hypothetical protein
MGDVCIMLMTAHRLQYAVPTLKAVLDKMTYSEGDIKVHIASDGDDSAYLCALQKVCHVHEIEPTASNSAGNGYGANFNQATQVIHQLHDVEFVLPLEDDWELRQDLELTPLVHMLRDTEYGCCRLGYIGWTEDMFGRFFGHEGMTYLELMHWSPEPHIFAGHPRLEKVSWEIRVGAWPEGLEPGQTELGLTARKEARIGQVWPIDLIKPMGDFFCHIGEERSY